MVPQIKFPTLIMMLYNLDFAYFRSFPGGSDGKESACNAGDLGSNPGSERSPGERLPPPIFLPRKIPWTEEPGGLQSMRSQRVGHN